MSEKKTIIFNGPLITNNKTRKNSNPKPKKVKPQSIIKPNTLKKSLLEKIKKHQQKERIIKTIDIETNKSTDDDMDFHNNFINSMEYLNKLSEKNKKEKRNRNKTIKNARQTEISLANNILDPHVLIDLPTDFDNYLIQPIIQQPLTIQPPIIRQPLMIHPPMIQPPMIQPPMIHPPMIQPVTPQYIIPKKMIIIPETPYGCLKGGNKPTFRQYHNKTLKNTHTSIASNHLDNPNTERQEKLKDLKKSYKKMKQITQKTKKTKFNLGRNNTKVSVLIKNNSTRRKIKKEHALLKQKSLNEIKKDLYEKNLIKIGSTAPNDVLRTLYEQSILAGDIHNTSSNVQLYNFINNK
jgi:hypothetical protein